MIVKIPGFTRAELLAASLNRLEFNNRLKDDEVIPLYVYSSFMKLKIDIGYSNGNYSVNDIKLL